MRIRAQLKGDMTEVRVLIAHIMETGTRRDSSGQIVPAHFIQTVTAMHNNKQVLSASFGPAVSQNPVLSFSFKGGNKGDKVTVTWVDNKGEKRTDEATIS
jgi:sulfur compound chelating protein SoxZ